MISHVKQQPITEQENYRAKPKDIWIHLNPKCQCVKSQTWMTRCELHITERRVYYRGSVCAYMWYWRCVCVFTSHRESTCFGRVTAAERTRVLPAWTTFTSVSFSFSLLVFFYYDFSNGGGVREELRCKNNTKRDHFNCKNAKGYDILTAKIFFFLRSEVKRNSKHPSSLYF